MWETVVEDVAGVGGGALDAVPVVDASLAGLGVDVEPLQVVVEVDGTGAEVASEERGVRGEDGRHVDPSPLGQRQGHSGEPLVEMCDDGFLLLVAHELGTNSSVLGKGAGATNSDP